MKFFVNNISFFCKFHLRWIMEWTPATQRGRLSGSNFVVIAHNLIDCFLFVLLHHQSFLFFFLSPSLSISTFSLTYICTIFFFIYFFIFLFLFFHFFGYPPSYKSSSLMKRFPSLALLSYLVSLPPNPRKVDVLPFFFASAFLIFSASYACCAAS